MWDIYSVLEKSGKSGDGKMWKNSNLNLKIYSMVVTPGLNMGRGDI